MLSEGKLLKLVDSFKKPTCTYVCSTRARVHVLYVRVLTEMAVETISHDQSYRSMPVN